MDGEGATELGGHHDSQGKAGPCGKLEHRKLRGGNAHFVVNLHGTAKRKLARPEARPHESRGMAARMAVGQDVDRSLVTRGKNGSYGKQLLGRGAEVPCARTGPQGRIALGKRLDDLGPQRPQLVGRRDFAQGSIIFLAYEKKTHYRRDAPIVKCRYVANCGSHFQKLPRT